MTAPSADSIARSGLVDAWLHRCGARPWRTYLLTWLAFLVLAIAIGFIGFTRMELSLQPPPPEGIPYSNFLAGGIRAIDGAIDRNPKNLPQFDPALERKDVGFLVIPAKDASPARLIAVTRGTLMTFGWPSFWLTWGSQQTWDVTDPTVPFPKCGGYFARGGVHWYPQNISFVSLSDGDSFAKTLVLESGGAYLILALPQMFAGFVVVVSYAINRSRRSWRQRRQRCPQCGHQRDPARPDATCAECGTMACGSISRKTNQFARPGLACGIIFGSLFAIWTALQFRNPSIDRYRSIGESIAARQSMNRAFVRYVYDESRGYGWPMHFIYKQVNHWYAFGGTEAVKTRCTDPLVRHDAGYLSFSIKSADPSIASLWTIYWPPALLQIGLLQILATMLTGALMAVTAAARRRPSFKAAPSAPAEHRTPASASSGRA